MFSHFFKTNPKGVFNQHVGQIGTGHAVVISGYNSTDNYFQFKNSWGEKFGIGGYFKMNCDIINFEFIDVYFLESSLS
jgi:C1A family cysteine protease